MNTSERMQLAFSLDNQYGSLEFIRDKTVVVVIGEHPQEATAFTLGKRFQQTLFRHGYSVFIERMPSEVTPIGSVVQGNEVDEYRTRLTWLRRGVFAKYKSDAIFILFHNSVYVPDRDNIPHLESALICEVTYPITEEFIPVKGFAVEIPALWKKTPNKKVLEWGQIKGEEEIQDMEAERRENIRQCIKEDRPILTVDELEEAVNREVFRAEQEFKEFIKGKTEFMQSRQERVDANASIYTKVVDYKQSNRMFDENEILAKIVHLTRIYLQGIDSWCPTTKWFTEKIELSVR